MNHFHYLFILFVVFATACTRGPQRTGLIFDTDMGPDYDDVGALALLHALADSGEVRLLATVSSNKLESAVPCIEVINGYFGRADLPTGAPKGHGVTLDTWHKARRWTSELPQRWAHPTANTSAAEDAVTVYRRMLSSQPDTSVTLVTVGFFTNLSGLLHSAPDSISPLGGRELVAKKVKRLVSMAGMFPDGKEFNIVNDAPSCAKVCELWPTPILFSGFDIGAVIFTGRQTAAMADTTNPVCETYAMCLPQDDPKGRNSWDETAALVAVRGAAPWFDTERGTMHIDLSDSTNHWTADPAGHHERLLFKMKPEQIGQTIETLMMHQPLKQAKNRHQKKR